MTGTDKKLALSFIIGYNFSSHLSILHLPNEQVHRQLT